jgi:predicted HTH transcriptional regulator
MASKVESLIQEFVIALRAAIAQEAAEAFVIAGGGVPRAKPGPKPKGATSATPKIKASKRKGGKRTAEEIESQGEAIIAYLKKNPASGAEQIGAALGMKTAELALPMAKLIKQKAVKFVGERRGRKYSVR